VNIGSKRAVIISIIAILLPLYVANRLNYKRLAINLTDLVLLAIIVKDRVAGRF
jgi:hypothetical protein